MKTCSKCKIEKPFEGFHTRKSSADGRRGVCRECRNATTRARNATDDGKALAKARFDRYKVTDKGKAAAARKNATEATKIRKSKWKKTDKGLAAEARYNTSDKGLATRKKAVATRRAVLLNAPTDDWKHVEVFDSANWQCFYCGIKVETRQDPKTYQPNEAHADHFVPLSNGGTNERKNIVCSCGQCNHEKLNRNPFEFIRDNINQIGGV